MAKTQSAADIKREIRDDNRRVAGWLIYYHERKAEYLQRREEIINSSSDLRLSELRDQSYISDVTGRKGAKLAELRKTEKWLEFVEEIEQRLPPKLQIILLMRRECRYSCRGDGFWREQVQQRYIEEMVAISGKRQEDVYISERIVRQWWERILEYSCRIAAKKGLL